jgi:hypothetical protein
MQASLLLAMSGSTRIWDGATMTLFLIILTVLLVIFFLAPILLRIALPIAVIGFVLWFRSSLWAIVGTTDITTLMLLCLFLVSGIMYFVVRRTG